jgi:hypothetical protein
MLRFQGRTLCRGNGAGPLGLMLVGHTADSPDETVQVAFACPRPANIPEALDNVTVERLSPRHYRVSSGGRSWTLNGVAHVHRNVGAAFYTALPPRSVPLAKRLFWHLILGLAATAPGRWLLLRGR